MQVSNDQLLYLFKKACIFQVSKLTETSSLISAFSTFYSMALSINKSSVIIC